MAAADFADLLSTGAKPSRVAFGSVLERGTFPSCSAPSRLGIEQGIRGAPHLGPGCYSPDPSSLFLRAMDARPRSRRGWLFGATTSGRHHHLTKAGSTTPSQSAHPSQSTAPSQGAAPGPAHYQKTWARPAETNWKPFNAALPRFSDDSGTGGKPGPGTYEHAVAKNRSVVFHESFGGRRDLDATITVKCTRGIPDKCGGCGQEACGDYHERGTSVRCRTCFQLAQQAGRARGYRKVRDCRSIHRHDFPGKTPRINLTTAQHEKRQRYREAYLSLYHS